MGQQLRARAKRRRRVAYLDRKKAAARASSQRVETAKPKARARKTGSE